MMYLREVGYGLNLWKQLNPCKMEREEKLAEIFIKYLRKFARFKKKEGPLDKVYYEEMEVERLFP